MGYHDVVNTTWPRLLAWVLRRVTVLLHTTETMQHNVVIDQSMDPMITQFPSHIISNIILLSIIIARSWSQFCS